MRASLLLLPFLLACPDGDPTPTGDTALGPQPGEFDYYVHLAELEVDAVGDLSCYVPGEDWLVQDVDEALQIDEPHQERVEDFENETPVYDATVDLWLDNHVEGAPDLSSAVDSAGNVTFDVPSCTPISYRARTPPELEETKDTYKAHHLFEPLAADAPSNPYLSVSRTTYLVIPGLVGESPDPTASIIAGRLFDCEGGHVEGAQVVVRDAEGVIPTSLEVKYFVDDFPHRDQPHTSEDGLWVAINVPPGTWFVEAWVHDGDGGHDLIGGTVLESYADSINISNIYTGIGDGVFYPDSCLVDPTATVETE